MTGSAVNEPTTDNRAYYDAFSERYDRGRSRGYHRLIDDQAAELVRERGTDKRVLEVGCGTGLILERVSRFAGHAEGIDLSPGMLALARQRGLSVQEASATALPFADATFDLVYSFKVLAHVPDIERALAEMVRVVQPGGHVIFDVYNRHSIRYAIKRWFGPRPTSKDYDEHAITTRFWSPAEAEQNLPAGTRLVDTAGIRIVTFHPALLRVPGLAAVIERSEWALMRSPLRRAAGFLVYVVEKTA